MTTETILTPLDIFKASRRHEDDLYLFARAIEQAVLQSPEVQNLIEAAQEFSDLYGWLWDTTDDGGFLSPEGVKRYDAAHDKLQAALCILQGKPLPYDPSLDDDFGDGE